MPMNPDFGGISHPFGRRGGLIRRQLRAMDQDKPANIDTTGKLDGILTVESEQTPDRSEDDRGAS